MSGETQAAAGEMEIPSALPVLPLAEVVLFPMAAIPLRVADDAALRAIDESMQANRMVAVLTQRQPRGKGVGPDSLYRIGCAGLIRSLVREKAGQVRLLLQGLERVRAVEFTQTEPYPIARVERAPELLTPGAETEALERTVRSLYRQVLQQLEEYPPEVAASLEKVQDTRQLIALVVSTAPFGVEQKQQVLEAGSTLEELRLLIDWLQHELSVREIQQRVTRETRRDLDQAQREHVLRQQLRTIQRELGEEGAEDTELLELQRKVEELPLSDDGRREAQRELSRLRRMHSSSAEYGIARSWLDWLIALPWGKTTAVPIELPQARAVLDEDHYNLEKIKERLLDSLAVRKLRHEREARASSGAAESGPLPVTPEDESKREPILCFLGPPGVGKTSLGQSIARALGRKFVRVSLGGVADEAEIRGHRRTYIGAMPGRILQSLRRAGSMDPVLMLDEVDKLGSTFRGDPSAALLEVLDPAQNNAFVDSYLGVPFDLSKALFICTANAADPIPGPLLDRMEVMTLSGYTEREKHFIARRFLLPKQIRANGLNDGELEVHDDALDRIIREYTREAGVRGLERQLSTVARKAARRISEGTQTPIVVHGAEVPSLLGRPRFFDQAAERVDRPGVATGLAWTPVGGEVLFVEAALAPGREALVLTGMLGDVMRESALAAVTFVRSRAADFGIDPKAFDGKSLHIHVPAGAIPKDGPSAGVAIMTAVASLGRNLPPRSDTAMTGEITLRGKVLPVGGIKEKVLAAHRAGIRRVILPARNEADLEEVPSEVRDELEFVPVDSADEVVEAALGTARVLQEEAVAYEQAAHPPM